MSKYIHTTVDKGLLKGRTIRINTETVNQTREGIRCEIKHGDGHAYMPAHVPMSCLPKSAANQVRRACF